MPDSVPPSSPLEEVQPVDPALAWVLPGYRASPSEAMQRIQALCAAIPDLFTAVLLVQLTHSTVPRDLLAVAIKQCRSDLDALTREDVASLLVAAVNGGKSGFEAVMRTRAGSPKKGGNLSWVKE